MARARGSVRKRGKSSFEIKFDVPSEDGSRQTRTVNYKCKSAGEAKKELTRLLGQIDKGEFVEPDKLTVAGHLRTWVKSADIQPKTRERYEQLIEQQVVPYLGGLALQRLRPTHIQDWHQKLLKKGGKGGAPLSPRTVGHAHRCLRTALRTAVISEKVSRNVAAVVPAPKVNQEEIEILGDGELSVVLGKLDDHWLHVIVVTALGSGARRGELLALVWDDLDLDAAIMRITKALEQTKAGLRVKPPKSKNGTRTITLPANVVAALRAHWAHALELRLQLGIGGKPAGTDPVFCRHDGSCIPPNDLSRDWARICLSKDLPRVSFHALRHTHPRP